MKHIIQKYFLILFFTFSFFETFSEELKTPEPQNTIRFTENKNQWNKNILYRAQLDGGVLFLEKNAFTYNFYDKETLRENHLKKNPSIKPINSHAFRMTFLNSEKTTVVNAKQITPDYCNFFIGKDKSKWVGDVKNYKEVNYENIYKGIDLQILGYQNSIKYNFIVAPEADAEEIKLFYEGLDNIGLYQGALQLKTSLNELTEQHPYAYQWIKGKRIEIPCEFILNKTTVSFYFPKGYDKGYELIVDPILVFACSSGSIADNFGMTATYDADGNLYSGGTCFDQGYPTTLGAIDTTYNGAVLYGRTDVVITKYDSSGTFLQYSTYLGGAVSTEIVTSLVVNAQNELLLYGATGSSDFPVTSNAYDTTYNGGPLLRFVSNGSYFDDGTDIYVTRFNSTGTTLLASTFIGGSLNDGVNHNNTLVSNQYPYDSLQYNYGDQYRGEINVDQSGNIYIASSTRSSDFPVVNGFDSTLDGMQDAIVFKFNDNLSQLFWSTYLGGKDNDAGFALALDDSSNVYVTGGTRSIDFPITIGAISSSHNGGKADGYITKIKSDGTAILFSTFFGTTAYDQCYFVQLDKDNDVYVVGQSEGSIPVTAGVYNNPNSGQFIAKVNDSLNTVIFSTVFGNGNGSPNISPSAFLVDYCENIYVSGWGGKIVTPTTLTTGMPLDTNAFQTTTDGHDFYLFVLAPNAGSLLYATYFGGGTSWEHVDGGTSRFDKKGIVYQSVCAGCGGNDDFPVTPGSWPNAGTNVNHSTNCNNGVFKFDFQVQLASADFTVDYLSGCAPLTVQFENQSSTSGKYLWDFGNNDTTSTEFNPTRIFQAPGQYLVRLLINDPASCNIWDTAFQYVTVYPAITADFDFVVTPCSNEVTFSDSSAIAPVSWLWYFDDDDSSTLENPTHIYDTAGTYNVTLISSTINGCKDTVVVQVDFVGTNPTVVSPSTSICTEQSTQLNASGGFAYSWFPATGLNNPNIANPVASPDTTTTYIVSVSTINALGDTCVAILSTTVFVYDNSTFPLLATADRDTISKGEFTIIHAITDTTLSISWNPAASLNNPNSYNPIASPSETTTYTVTITDSAGCPKTATVTIYVISMRCNSDDVFVPNTFTPNGDNQNDILFVRSNSIDELYFAVYNRWGQIVFETTDIKKGWDGIYEGKNVDPAVFAWYLRAKCYNGDELIKKGNTTLIR